MRVTLANDDPNWGAQNGASHLVVMDVQGNQHCSLSSLGNDGLYYIQDGKRRDGSPSVLLQRCR